MTERFGMQNLRKKQPIFAIEYARNRPRLQACIASSGFPFRDKLRNSNEIPDAWRNETAGLGVSPQDDF